MIITISREYGAGGRTVARGLAQELGIEYYDIDFVRMTAKLSGYSEDDIRREGEDMSGGRKFINQFLSTNAYNSSYDAIFEAQREVILDLAKKPCIIVGRCSNMILREEGIDSFDIFLRSGKLQSCFAANLLVSCKHHIRNPFLVCFSAGFNLYTRKMLFVRQQFASHMQRFALDFPGCFTPFEHACRIILLHKHSHFIRCPEVEFVQCTSLCCTLLLGISQTAQAECHDCGKYKCQYFFHTFSPYYEC